jgi:hypothetical protein
MRALAGSGAARKGEVEKTSTCGKKGHRSLKIMYYETEMRALCNSLMAVLVVVALFWGNCFSCPQILLAAQRHHCCPHSKSGANDCQTQGLRNFVKAEKAPQSVPAAATVSLTAIHPATTSVIVVVTVPVPPEYTPPDSLPLRI